MFGTLKYLFLYLYEASEKLEQKATAFAEERKARMEEFRRERLAKAEQVKKKMEEKKSETSEKIKEQIRLVMKELGVSTKEEMDEVKRLLADLNKKIEGISAKK